MRPWGRTTECIIIGALLMWAALLSVPTAHAAARPVPGDAVLGFADTYETAAGMRTHTGVDLVAAAGDAVAAPVDGTVLFVGPVPATDGSSSRVTCVTIGAGSDRWTLLPLEHVRVSKGEPVSIRQRLGVVAASGDGSIPGPHVHVGLRRNGSYVDPMARMEVAVPEGGLPEAGGEEAGEDVGGGQAPVSSPAQGSEEPERFASQSPEALTEAAGTVGGAVSTEIRREAATSRRATDPRWASSLARPGVRVAQSRPTVAGATSGGSARTDPGVSEKGPGSGRLALGALGLAFGVVSLGCAAAARRFRMGRPEVALASARADPG